MEDGAPLELAVCLVIGKIRVRFNNTPRAHAHMEFSLISRDTRATSVHSRVWGSPRAFRARSLSHYSSITMCAMTVGSTYSSDGPNHAVAERNGHPQYCVGELLVDIQVHLVFH